jgi:AcrR family transcriptional regulator
MSLVAFVPSLGLKCKFIDRPVNNRFMIDGKFQKQVPILQETVTKPNRKVERRKISENRLMDAFETILLRDGVNGLGVNAIVSEAGVGKGLIYHYFDGLNGLAKAWMKRADLAPEKEEIAGEGLAAFMQKSAAEQLASIEVNYATMLRERPAACQILAETLKVGSSLPESLEAVRLEVGKSHEELLMSVEEFQSPENMALIFVLQAASNYLAMRANSSPNYNGVQLDTDEGWEMMMGMIRTVAKMGAKS